MKMCPMLIVGVVAAAWCAVGGGAAWAGNADRVEEILGTPHGIEVKEFVITAKNYEFKPSVIVVKQGDYFKLKVTSTDVNRGIKIAGTSVRHALKKGQPEEIVLYARDRGKVTYQCSKFCGMGCFLMKGTIIIE